jgi:dephospho-CoA kinase
LLAEVTDDANTLIVGLTGGIGSGKSAAANHFARLGATVVDTDLIAHELTASGGAAMGALQGAFGNCIVATDGRLDRSAMRALAFADPAARRRLESILHPLIRAETERRCKLAAANGAPYIVLVVPLLVESGDYRQRVGRILVVDCADELRIARVELRSGLSRAEIERVMAAQAGRSDRLAAADDIIRNDGPPAELTAQVERLHLDYLARASRIRQTTGNCLKQ